MEVILKEDVPKLGQRGEVVKVAEGYGRNYLLPHRLAIEATKANRAVIEQMKQSAVRKSAVEKNDAETLAKQLEGASLAFHRKAGEKDHLFGSVTSSDIAEALERKGFSIEIVTSLTNLLERHHADFPQYAPAAHGIWVANNKVL